MHLLYFVEFNFFLLCKNFALGWPLPDIQRDTRHVTQIQHNRHNRTTSKTLEIFGNHETDDRVWPHWKLFSYSNVFLSALLD